MILLLVVVVVAIVVVVITISIISSSCSNRAVGFNHHWKHFVFEVKAEFLTLTQGFPNQTSYYIGNRRG